MTTPETFIDRWDSHIEQLARIKLACDAEDAQRIDEIQKELKEITRRAVE